MKDMVRWLERAVIGLNLCPFAKGVHAKGQIHYVVSAATDAEALAQDLRRELADLAAAPAEVRDTTLLMAPDCLQDFLEFNDFLGVAEDVLEELDLDGTLQIASFHPQFQFAGTDAGDVTTAPIARHIPPCTSCAKTVLTGQCRPTPTPKPSTSATWRCWSSWVCQAGRRWTWA